MYFPLGENLTKDTGGLSSSEERHCYILTDMYVYSKHTSTWNHSKGLYTPGEQIICTSIYLIDFLMNTLTQTWQTLLWQRQCIHSVLTFHNKRDQREHKCTQNILLKGNSIRCLTVINSLPQTACQSSGSVGFSSWSSASSDEGPQSVPRHPKICLNQLW